MSGDQNFSYHASDVLKRLFRGELPKFVPVTYDGKLQESQKSAKSSRPTYQRAFLGEGAFLRMRQEAIHGSMVVQVDRYERIGTANQRPNALLGSH
jgi:hypothetical protein